MSTYRDRGIMLAALVVLFAAFSAGCATSPESVEEGDPFQPMNRGFNNFNTGLDEAIIKPVAETYVDVTPEAVQDSVSNFFDNISYPNVIVNDLLQGKLTQGLSDIGRFLINSTVGLLGLFDPASSMGMAEHDEDLGQTLGVWGAGEGVYLELPFFGPNSMRDAPDIPLSAYTNLLFYVSEAAVTVPLGILGAIDTRAQLLTATKVRDESALDPYIFTREAYRQRRVHLIYDGDPPLEEFDETEY